jgi:carbonic anhydrase
MVSQDLVRVVIMAIFFIYLSTVFPEDRDVILGAVIFSIFALGCIHIYERKRQKQLEELSRQTGFMYIPEATIEFPDLKFFTLGRRSNWGNLLMKKSRSNLLTATRNFIKWSIFDYVVPVDDWPKQTIVMAQLHRELPEFYLLTEHFHDRVREYRRFEDIDIEGYPEFSLRYHLKGKDENAIRQLFTPHVILTILNESLKSNIEAKGNFIIIYTPKKRYELADMYEFFQKAETIVDLFK